MRERWKKVCVESGCGKFQVRNSRCDGHAKIYELKRGSRHERGYGSEHDSIRRALLVDLRNSELRGVVLICWRCLEPIHSWQELDADHSRVTALEGGKADCLTHSECNRGKRTPPPLDPRI